MRQTLAIAALLALLTPAAALAQSPSSTLATPYDEVTVPPPPAAEPATPAAYHPEPQARGDAYELGAPTPPRPVQVDPEILALRNEAEDDEPPRTGGPSFGASFGHAWAGFGLGSAAGALTGGVIGAAACGNGSLCILAALLGSGAGAMLTAPFGAGLATWGFGESSGGTGNAFASIGGAYLGSGIGVGLTALLAQLEPTFGSTLGVAAGIVLTNLGAAIGYQVTSHGSRAPDDAGSDGATIVPVAAPSSDGHGFTAGAAGRF
jgi:hypothetical protein